MKNSNDKADGPEYSKPEEFELNRWFDSIRQAKEKAIPLFVVEDSINTSSSNLYSRYVPAFLEKYGNSPDVVFFSLGHRCKKINKDDLLYSLNKRKTTEIASLDNFIPSISGFIQKDTQYDLFFIINGQFQKTSRHNFKTQISKSNILPHLRSSFVMYVNQIKPNAGLSYHLSAGHANILFYVCARKEPPIYVKPEYSMSFIEARIAEFDGIDSISDFSENYEFLLAAIKATTYGRGQSRYIHDRVAALQQKLLKTVSNSVDTKRDAEILVEALSKKNLDQALKYGSLIVENEYLDKDFTKQFQELFRACAGKTKSKLTYDNICARTSRAQETEGIELNAISEIPAPDKNEIPDSPTFLCPITYDDEVDPVILISKPKKPILSGIASSTANIIITNPLNGYVLKPFAKKFAQYLDCAISLHSYREAQNSGFGMKISPVTRQPVLGLVTLGKHPSHVKATNWTLSKLTSGGKKLGNNDFWFALLWLLIEDGSIPHLQDVLPFVREHMIFRLMHGTSRASLMGRPGFITRSLPLGAACWFALSSPYFKTPPRGAFNTVRANLIHIGPLIKLCDLIGYIIPDEIPLYVKRLRVLFSLMFWLKKTKGTITSIIEGIKQKVVILSSKHIDPVIRQRESQVLFIPLDGNPTPTQISEVLNYLPVYCRDIPIEDLYSIGKMLDRNLAVSQIHINSSWKPFPIPEPFVEWTGYNTPQVTEKLIAVQLCPKTMRPFYYEDPPITWKESFDSTVIQPVRRLNEGRFYASFVKKYKKYPTVDEFVLFLYSRHVVNGPMKTLPSDTWEIAKDLVDSYDKITIDVSPAQFIKRYDQSKRIESRIKIEFF